ncbi:MAG: hypothetical protein OK456_01550 [Thaumarchaeota archaeon]|nr:hypothetical protein [Nitrososphaerota archaeon]
MPVCPKCHKLISEKHFARHLKRCGTSHHHEPQSLYVPSLTAQIESPNRGITYGPPSSPRLGKKKKRNWWFVAGVATALLVIFLVVLDLFLR